MTCCAGDRLGRGSAPATSPCLRECASRCCSPPCPFRSRLRHDVALARLVDPALRDETLFRYACQLRAEGTKVVRAARLVRAAWARCEQPAGSPYTVTDALAKLDQAWGYAYTPADTSSVVTGRVVRLTPVTQIKIRPVRWTWQDRVPLGEVTMTPGRGGVGKSTFHAWLIAGLTRGTVPGAYHGTPRGVPGRRVRGFLGADHRAAAHRGRRRPGPGVPGRCRHRRGPADEPHPARRLQRARGRDRPRRRGAAVCRPAHLDRGRTA
jgi:hypothetical protein